MVNFNLNDWSIYAEDDFLPSQKFIPTTKSVDGSVELYFRDIEDTIVRKIMSYPIVLGCVAWLTNEKILKALATRELVQIIVQKEDFLRPDSDNWTSQKLNKLYNDLPKGLAIPTHFGNKTNTILDGVYKYHGDGEFLDAIRWAGEFNVDQKTAFPRMHNKFLVFCDSLEELYSEEEDDLIPTLKPLAVWTGSFNMTYNSTNSLENGLFLRDKNIVLAYYRQWAEIVGISDMLDWSTNYDEYDELMIRS